MDRGEDSRAEKEFGNAQNGPSSESAMCDGSRGTVRQIRKRSDFQESPGPSPRCTRLPPFKDSNIRDRSTAGGFARGTRETSSLRKRYVDGPRLHFCLLPYLSDGGRRRLPERQERPGGRGEKHLLRTSVNTRCSVYFRTTLPVSYYIRIADSPPPPPPVSPRSLLRHADCPSLP